MSDVFLSYSRKDTKLVREIFESLSARKREAWIDLHDIEYSAKWWEEICAGIDGADNFVLFVSPNSLESLFCHREIQHALKHNKRIIPCLLKGIDQQTVFQAWQSNPDLNKYEQMAHENWDRIQAIQWIDISQMQDVNLAVDALLKTVDTDPERVKLHTRLLLRLRDWESRGRNPSGLLRGDELTLYEQWFSESRQKETQPHPTEEQEAYITESRRAQDESEAKRIQRERLVRRFKTASGVLGGFLVLAVIATFLTIRITGDAVNTANAQVDVGHTQVAVGNKQVAAGHTQVAVIGETLTPIPPKLTAVGQTVVAGSYMIESLNLSAEANAILRTAGGNAETAALLSIRVLRKIYLASADSALVEAIGRLRSVPRVFDVQTNIKSVSFSPDGKTFLASMSASMETGGAELRDTESGNVIWTREIQTPNINSVAFSPDGKWIIAAGGDRTAMLWDASTGKPIRVFTGHGDAVQRAIFSPDSKTVLTLGGGSDLTVRLWNVETGDQIYSVPSGGGFSSLFFFPDGLSFYAADNVYSTADGRQLQGTGMGGGTLAISPNGQTFVTGISPKALLKDVTTGQVLHSLSGHTDSVISAAFSNDGKMLVTGSWDNNARVWDVASGKLLLLLSANSGGVDSVAFSPDGMHVLTGSKTARLWSITMDDPLQQTISAPAGITTLALAPDGKTILTGDVNGKISLWDLTTKQLLFNIFENSYDAKDVAISSDGKLAAAAIQGSPTNSVFGVFDTTTGALLQSFDTESLQPFIVTLTFSSDSKMIFAGYMDDTARLWDIESGKLLREFKGNDPLSHGSFTYSPDGKLVTINGGMIWWDISTGEQANFPGEMHGDKIEFSADGSLVAISNYSDGGTAIVDVASRQLVNRVSGSGTMVFSPDNKLLLTAGGDNTAQLWEISTGRLLRIYSGHTAPVTSVAFMPDGQRIVTGSLDGTIRTWITDYNDLLAYACTRVGTDFTPGERNHYGISDQDPTCPQFGEQSQSLMPTTTPMPTRTPLPAWTPIATPTPD